MSLQFALATMLLCAIATPGEETKKPAAKDIESEIEEILAVNRDGIEANRTTMITLRTAPGATVKVNQIRHAFEFGTAINNKAFVPNDRISEADREKYKQILKANFNSVVHENEMKWYSNEKERGKLTFDDADAMLDWSEANGLYTRGHCVYWDKDAHVQKWQKELDNDSLRNAIKQRASDYMGHFKDRVHEHDVNNEMLHYNYYGKRLGKNIRKEMFDWCGELDPKATLYVNEFNIIAGNDTDKYVAQIEGFLKDGMKVGGIGVQGHFGGKVNGPEVKRKLDLLAKFGLPIKVTEYDCNTGDERGKAIALVTLYSTAFAHPAIEGIYMWGFWEKAHWIPTAAIWKADWRETLAAKYFRELLFKRWWTKFEGKADGNGSCEVRIFFGEQEVTVNGQTRRFTIDKKSVNKIIDCKAPEPAKWVMVK